MKRLVILLTLLPVPAFADWGTVLPAARPRTTGVPELDALLRRAKATGRDCYQQFIEDGKGLRWFRATPDGWLSYAEPPAKSPTNVGESEDMRKFLEWKRHVDAGRRPPFPFPPGPVPAEIQPFFEYGPVLLEGSDHTPEPITGTPYLFPYKDRPSGGPNVAPGSRPIGYRNATPYYPRPEVAQPMRATFRGSEPIDPDHVCDRCGATQVVVSGWNADGTHSHVCDRCGNRWRH